MKQKILSKEELVATLDDMLMDGPLSNIYDYERARALYLKISEYSSELNKATYGAFFGTVQQLALKEMYLSISKMFDPVKKHETRSFPVILSKLAQNAECFPISLAHHIHRKRLNGEAPQTVLTKTENGVRCETKWIGLPEEGSADPQEMVALHDDIFEGMPSLDKAKNGHDLSLKLCKVLDMRDRRFAHNDHVQVKAEIIGASLEEMDELADWCKAAFETLTRCVIPNYCVYTNDTYPHTQSAEEPSRNLVRMLYKSGFIENPGYFIERD